MKSAKSMRRSFKRSAPRFAMKSAMAMPTMSMAMPPPAKSAERAESTEDEEEDSAAEGDSTGEKEVVDKSGKPSFERLVKGQSSGGSWSMDHKAMLKRFLPKGATFPSPPATLKSKVASVWLTFVALYILDEEFGAKETQWTLIAQKAKGYLKA